MTTIYKKLKNIDDLDLLMQKVEKEINVRDSYWSGVSFSGVYLLYTPNIARPLAVIEIID
jgi:hypothetical protein